MSLSLSLSSFSILGAATTLVLLGACTNPVILATGGSGGSGTSSSTTSSTSSTTTGTGAAPGTGGDANACTAAGGTCEFTGESCSGTMGDGAEAAACGPAVGAFCCLPVDAACTAAGGTCKFSGETCDGSAGPPDACGASVGAFCCVPATSCDHPCPVEMLGQTQCAGGYIETCTVVGSCSVWVITSPCPTGMECDSAAAKCITGLTTCTATSDVQCGCGCGNDGEVECTGGLPPSCDTDTDCGPTCQGLVCHESQCTPWACNPGTDASCNADASMPSLAGTCNADGTCTCKAGFTIQDGGRCG
jgi:hypothetical protein